MEGMKESEGRVRLDEEKEAPSPRSLPARTDHKCCFDLLCFGAVSACLMSFSDTQIWLLASF